ncbi:Endonuclease III [Minicystis rosea]|nr:Endonuclease III [Minicystis rosea]
MMSKQETAKASATKSAKRVASGKGAIPASKPAKTAKPTAGGTRSNAIKTTAGKRASKAKPVEGRKGAGPSEKAKASGSTRAATEGRERRAPSKTVKPVRLTRAEIKAAREHARATYAKLRGLYPDAHCELDHRDPFTLLVATVLSAQTTDVLVNKVTPHLFARYPDAPSLAAADPAEVGELMRARGLGMYNQKAKNIVGLSRGLMERHGGQVPRTLAELVELPGVGRKTANVVLGVAFGTPEGVVVDTHVQRLSQRLGWTVHTDPPEIEPDLCGLFPREDWDMLSHTLIFHGRRACFAQRPACASCGVSGDCPSAFRAETIGRKNRG